ncbi:HNH endonuclease [Bowmanella yangjiangensis]|uniref:HNH endonuclease n=1 Tax=Bowmanella yangjiangensis TaxID=2811230 RepID=A0ABS3CNM2_9ALTE|nr:HNH endonuclease signature motif containing protein [Bowmanella yangjiangensis]MBN7818712.1 HNH endonuclease [Bowmanella yangjiangensis]
MARRSKRNTPESLRVELIKLLTKFEEKLLDENLREQVKGLVPANHLLRDLGSSLIKDEDATSARDRILSYLRKYPGMLLDGDELMVVAGISEYARRIRELRVQMGWPILAGKAIKDMLVEGEVIDSASDSNRIKTDTYFLVQDQQDKEAAFRWNLANEIRKKKISVKDKIITYLRENVGKEINGEELKYLANDKSEWARRVRELRTEDGWPVATRQSGRPELKVGVYVLEENRQAEVHDRKIPDPVRVETLERDHFSCKVCGWNYSNRRAEDKIRNLLELHHIEHHASGGKNELNNLITLCNVCHDDVHRGNKSNQELKELIAVG